MSNQTLDWFGHGRTDSETHLATTLTNTVISRWGFLQGNFPIRLVEFLIGLFLRLQRQHIL